MMIPFFLTHIIVAIPATVFFKSSQVSVAQRAYHTLMIKWAGSWDYGIFCPP